MTRAALVVLALAAVSAAAGARQAEPVDAATNAKIRDEGLTRSQVGAVFSHLVDTIGPRLAASPAYTRAAEYARDRLKAWGLANARLEPFEFSRGWTLERYTLEMVEPRYMPLIGYPEAWSASTPGELTVPAVSLAGRTADEVEAMRSRIAGAAILSQPMVDNFIRADRAQPTEGPEAPPAEAGRGGNRGGRGGRGGRAGGGPTEAQRIEAILRSGPAAVQLRASRGEHGTLFVQAGRGETPDNVVPRVVLIGEHYNLIMRLLAAGQTVRLRVNVQGRLHDGPTSNVLAELPGTDPVLRDEVVMLGAHLDSWHTAAGATDNADGSAVVLEAMRILKAIGATPRRTIRVALWGAEEQGLVGSAAWVARHLAGDGNAAQRDRLVVYFNMDPGKGPIYGWFMENNAAARPIFDAWLAPFRDLGARRNVPQGIGNTDHLSFIREGIAAFNPVQDYVGYDVREHHTQVDTAERIDEADLRQAAVIMASFVWHAAERGERIPR